MTSKVLIGDVRAVLKTLPSNSVHCAVTSPPYWGLRSYLPEDHPQKHLEIGSEATVDEWVQTMVEVLRDVRRVLRPDGTLWLNLGDSYAGDRDPKAKQTLAGAGVNESARAKAITQSRRRDNVQIPRSDTRMPGIKPKDLIGQPWLLAFALRADGWWLRQEIIWSKPNPMPESIRDRCTKSHEHIFLLSKSERYFYDFEGAKEPTTGGAQPRRGYKYPDGWDTGAGGHGTIHREGREKGQYRNNGVGFGHGYDAETKPRVAGVNPKAALGAGRSSGKTADGASGRMGREPGWRNKQNESFSAAVVDTVEYRNRRSVWTIPTHGFKGAHFATFPPELARRCITAGCPIGGTVLDPFGGSGTVGLVAERLHRHSILIDIDERNGPMASERMTVDAPLFAQVEVSA